MHKVDQKAVQYLGAKAVLSTMHGKATAIAPVLQERLGMLVEEVFVDTDRLGTFTGEISRPGNMLQTAIAKASLGMAAADCKLGLASEGSFAPVEYSFFPVGRELLVLVDEIEDVVISEAMFTPEIVCAGARFGPDDELAEFLDRAQFPSHRLIVRTGQDSQGPVRKGIAHLDELQDAIRTAASRSPDAMAIVESDMRAHMNPTRMRSLVTLAERLARRLANPCPACSFAGFGQTGVESGLPCSGCSRPTSSTRAEIWSCCKCGYRQSRVRTDERKTENPIFCGWCNP